jgi:hypothetical protein
MTRDRKSETRNDREARLKKNAQDVQDTSHIEDEAIDAMVRKSIKYHGA